MWAAALSYLLDAFMVAGVVWPYIPQALSINRTRNAEGFSTMVSFVLILSGTLRCFFWLGEPFETVLLVQAIASVLAQLGMMYVVTKANAAAKKADGPRAPRRFLDLNPADFWAWDDWLSYLQFVIALVLVLALVCKALLPAPWFVQILGTAALGIEAMLPVPQALANHRKKSTEGLSPVLIFSWAFGDSIKTVYALAKKAPMQFVGCGLFQLAMDFVVLAQWITMRNNGSSSAAPTRKSPRSGLPTTGRDRLDS